jgi:hypothetical protein
MKAAQRDINKITALTGVTGPLEERKDPPAKKEKKKL